MMSDVIKIREFEFKSGSLEAADLKVGDKVEFTYSEFAYFTVGKYYLVMWNGLRLVLKADGGISVPYLTSNLAKFRPVKIPAPSVAPPPQQQGVELQHILPRRKEGDLLECEDGSSSSFFTTGRKYIVKGSTFGLYIEADDGVFARDSGALFVFATNQPEQAEDEHYTCGIGKQYKAPKKECDADVDANVCGHKAFDLIKGLL